MSKIIDQSWSKAQSRPQLEWIKQNDKKDSKKNLFYL